MFSITVSDFILTMAGALLIMGIITLACGVYILVSKVMGKDIQTLATQTTKLAQKGVAEDVAGLVGNASSLIDAMNQMVKTSSGIGIFLVLISFALMSASFWLVIQIH
jgi:hypothetical protein